MLRAENPKTVEQGIGRVAPEGVQRPGGERDETPEGKGEQRTGRKNNKEGKEGKEERGHKETRSYAAKWTEPSGLSY